MWLLESLLVWQALARRLHVSQKRAQNHLRILQTLYCYAREIYPFDQGRCLKEVGLKRRLDGRLLCEKYSQNARRCHFLSKAR